MIKLDSDIQYLKGVGERRAGLLKRLGVTTVGGLLRFYPRAYEDWSHIVAIDEAPYDVPCCVKAIVDSKPTGDLIRKGLTIYRTDVTDGKSIMRVTIFNSRYTADKLRAGEEYLFFGRVTGNLWGREMNSPAVEKAQGGDRIRPIYHCTEGLSSGIIERLVKTALDGTADGFAECLPQALRDRYGLCGIREALTQIHFPDSDEALDAARKRLIFEELLTLRLGLMLLRSGKRGTTGITLEQDYTGEFLNLLPFKPTDAQKKAVGEAARDMLRSEPMNRLIQGDVGSGKTAVAAALVYSAAKNGVQSALMAPTEILAAQHFRTFSSFFEGTGIVCALLTGSTKVAEKRAVKERVKSGEISLLIGTHAVIQKDVEFKRLGLIVTDEQHRFGVMQRGQLTQKGLNPHTLVMSATPIPRTLALMIYGDLDVSVLDEMPPGRMPPSTYLITGDKRERAYKYIKQHLDRGVQGYVVCPLVEEGETELAAAQEYKQTLEAGAFAGYRLGLLHGRLKAKDKEAVMAGFIGGDIQLLVSTTVIEVGVDVTNAVIMLIENAERFGLSQLHQLRGRIGRGSEKSTCILVSDAQNDEAQKRLKLMVSTTDGFKIAEEDLKLRGPGDFFGARQHGLPELKIADMLTDTRLLAIAGRAADEILKADPRLKSEENKGLRGEVAALFRHGGVGN